MLKNLSDSDNIDHIIARIRSPGSSMLLATTKIKLTSDSGQLISVRALSDPASQAMFITCREETSFSKTKNQRDHVRSMKSKSWRNDLSCFAQSE